MAAGSCERLSTTSTAFSSCGSCPARQAFGSNSTSMSGHAGILDLPLAFGRAESEMRRGHRATVHQHRIAADANQSAPCAFADEWADAGAAEDPRHVVAATPAYSLMIIAFGRRWRRPASCNLRLRASPSSC